LVHNYGKIFNLDPGPSDLVQACALRFDFHLLLACWLIGFGSLLSYSPSIRLRS